MTMASIAEAMVRESIEEILREFLVQPFSNVGEADYQAVALGCAMD